MTEAIPAAGRVLVVNAGSSSLKLRVLDPADAVTARPICPHRAVRRTPRRSSPRSSRSAPIDAVGHRIVHGGTLYTAPVQVNDQVRQRLESLTDLAPLHQPKSLAALDAVQAVLPAVPAVACFDTAFHATIPAAAATFALPEEWRTRWNLRRYGFHGLSHSYVVAARRRNSSAATMTTCGLSPATSARAPHSPRSAAAGRWTPRWGSRRWTAW